MRLLLPSLLPVEGCNKRRVSRLTSVTKVEQVVSFTEQESSYSSLCEPKQPLE